MFEDDLAKKYISQLYYAFELAGFNNFTIVDKPAFEHPENGRNILVSSFNVANFNDFMQENKQNHVYIFAAGCDFNRGSLRVYVDKKGA